MPTEGSLVDEGSAMEKLEAMLFSEARVNTSLPTYLHKYTHLRLFFDFN